LQEWLSLVGNFERDSCEALHPVRTTQKFVTAVIAASKQNDKSKSKEGRHFNKARVLAALNGLFGCKQARAVGLRINAQRSLLKAYKGA
jgi:hypothetical protein